MVTVRMSDAQAHQFASLIIPDIRTYVAAHQQQYDAFITTGGHIEGQQPSSAQAVPNNQIKSKEHDP
jgi:hypothetical protein